VEAPRVAPAGPVVPAQLPLDVAGFTGRDAELERLDGILTTTGDYPTSVLVAVLSGTAGVGKTALAVHWAHRVAHRFRDGQLYVNLRGFDPRGPAMPPAEAVRGFLDAFEVPPQRIPSGLAARVNLYRSLVAGRRMLVVLDNAADADQVRPLLPGAPGCLALVTSRHRLDSLAVIEGARPVPVDLLSPAEARDLLARKLGDRAVAAAPEATDEVIASCARLPLALAVAAARAAGPPAVPLAALSAALRAGRGRLDAFVGEDPSADIRTVLSLSYRALDPAAARMFRLLAAHPTAEVGPSAAASLADATMAAARRSLAELARAHLLIDLPGGRYTCHDLLRAYAAELLSTEDTPAEQDAAVDRLLDHYLHTAHAAAILLQPHRDRLSLGVPRDGVSPEQLADHDAALAWFTTEHAALLGAITRAASTGRHRHAWQLAWTPIDYFDRRGHWHDQVTAQRSAVAAAARLGDRAGQAYSLRGLARACSRLGDYDEALEHYERALELFGAVGDAAGQARTHLSLSVVFERQRRYPDALHHTQQALKLYRQVGQVAGEAEALNGVAWCHAQLGEYPPAQSHCERALALLQDLGDVHSEANSWDTLGYIHDKLGDHGRAIDCYLRAVELFRQTGGRYFEADTLARLGDAHRAAGDPASAANALRRSLRILEELGHPDADRVRAQLATF
jgi:tetratricopeptide (TPR) repeat protein